MPFLFSSHSRPPPSKEDAMTDRLRSIALTLAIVLVVLFSALGPDPVRADDGAPPPPPDAGQTVDAAETTDCRHRPTRRRPRMRPPPMLPRTMGQHSRWHPAASMKHPQKPCRTLCRPWRTPVRFWLMSKATRYRSQPRKLPRPLPAPIPGLNAGGGVTYGYSSTGGDCSSYAASNAHTSATPMQDAINAAPCWYHHLRRGRFIRRRCGDRQGCDPHGSGWNGAGQ